MKRGRKQDDTLPPSRSREIQRAFRQRRSDYIRGLEERVSQLENEVDEILARHGEPLRYNTAEVVAARSASRKKPKNKSKHNLSQFVDVEQLADHSARSSSAPVALVVENSLVITPPPAGSSQDIGGDLSPTAHYVLRDINGELSSTQSSPPYPRVPFEMGSHIDSQPEYDCRNNESPSILSRRSKPLLQLWEANCKSNVNQTSPKSPLPSSQLTHSISTNEYQTPSSQMEMLIGMDSVVPSPDVPSHLVSSLELPHEMRAHPPCSLPGLVADSSPPHDQLAASGFHAYHSSHDAHSTPYPFRPPSSQLPERFNQCSYGFANSPNCASSNVSLYQESPLSLFRSRHPMPDQPTLHHDPLSTLMAIAATRLDHFEHSKSDCNYQAVALQPSPALVEAAVSSDSSGTPEISRENMLSLGQDDYVRATPSSSTASSEPRELESGSQSGYSQLASPRLLSGESLPVDDLGRNQNAGCVSIYHENITREWRDLNVLNFPKDYQPVNYSE